MKATLVHPVTLRFADSRLEAAFIRDFHERNVGLVRLSTLLSFSLYALFGILDKWMVPEVADKILLIRAVVCMLLLGFYGFTFHPVFQRFWQEAIALIYFLVGVGILAMVLLAEETGGYFYYAGLMLVVLGVHALFRLRFVHATLVTWVLIGCYEVIAIGMKTTPPHILINNNFFLISANVIGMFASYALEGYARQVFWQTRALEEKHGQLEEKSGALESKNEELEAALEHLKATQVRLVQQEKLASLGQLTAGIAHEIKNPLNFINNFAELSGELVGELDEELRALGPHLAPEALEEVTGMLCDLKRNAEKINEHGRRADGIVRSMLLHSRGKPGEHREVELNTLVEEYVGLSYHGMRAQVADFNVEIERDYDEAVGKVELVPQEIGRVLINLLNNAFYAVHEAARVCGADGRDGPYAPKVAVRTRRLDDTVEVRVEDNGSGIPEQVRQKIFEPFFTTKPTGVGTGLGLSLAYEIVVHGHGGRLSAESEEGEGTTFVITLPAEKRLLQTSL